MGELIAVGIGGFIGSYLRFILTRLAERFSLDFPYGTLLSNVIAGLAIGFIIGLEQQSVTLNPKARLFLTTGLLGGLSTFSTFSMETINLFHDGKILLAVGNIALNLGLSLFGVLLGMFFAKAAARVYGIESSPHAVNDAILTAETNGVSNIEFILGKAEEKIYEFVEKGIQVDIIVVDPPRKGCDAKFLEAVAKLKPKKVAYISCNPDTLARDLKFLAECGYGIRAVKPFDMFCHTVHVECVVVLERE